MINMELKDDSTQPRKKQKLVQHDPRDSLVKFVSAVRGEVKEIDLLFPSTTNQEDLYKQLFQSEQLVRVKCRDNQSKDVPVSGVNLRSEEEDAWTCTWDEQDSLLDAWILPQGIEWPSLQSGQDPKQDDALGRRVLFQRTAIHCKGRDTYTIKALRRMGKKVAWVGLPGIGKSASLSNLLLIFIRKLGEEGWPKNIYLRLGKHVILFTWSNENDGGIEVKKMKCRSLHDFQEVVEENFIEENKKKTDYVVLMELEESENDPKIIFPHFVTASSRNAKDVLKTFDKGGGRFLLSDPPSWPELFIMRELLSLEEIGGFISAEAQQGRVLNPEDFLQAYKSVGPIPRNLLSSDAREKVNNHKESMQDTIADFFKITEIVNMFNVPSDLKLFAAPFVRKGVRLPVFGGSCVRDGSLYKDIESILGFDDKAMKTYAFRFLSSYSENLIASNVKNPEEFRALEKYGLAYQVLEKAVLHSFFLSRNKSYNFNSSPRFKLDNWEFRGANVIEPSSGEVRKTRENITNDVVKKKFFDAIEENVELVEFKTMYHKEPVTSLDEKSVYMSTVINSPFCVMKAVNHKLKTVTAVQTTDLTPIQHCFKASTIINFMKNMGMFEGDGCNYKINLIIVTTTDVVPQNEAIYISRDLNKTNEKGQIIEGVSDQKYKEIIERLNLVSVIRKM